MRTRSQAKAEHRAAVVDVGTLLAVADIPEYQSFAATLLNADRVRVVRIAENNRKTFLVFLEAFGNIGKIATARLLSRGTGFCFKWEEDAADHGELKLSRVIFG